MPAFTARPAAKVLATLVALTLAACDATASTGPTEEGGDSTPSVPSIPSVPTPSTPSTPTSSVPAAIVGAWRYGSVSPTTFWDDHTGLYSGSAYGMSDQYEFAANGTFKEYVYIYTQSYGCRTQAWVEMQGSVQFDDEKFTKRVWTGRFKTTNSCASSSNTDRAMTAAEMVERSKSETYVLRTDAAGKTYLQILDGRYDRTP